MRISKDKVDVVAIASVAALSTCLAVPLAGAQEASEAVIVDPEPLVAQALDEEQLDDALDVGLGDSALAETGASHGGQPDAAAVQNDGAGESRQAANADPVAPDAERTEGEASLEGGTAAESMDVGDFDADPDATISDGADDESTDGEPAEVAPAESILATPSEEDAEADDGLTIGSAVGESEESSESAGLDQSVETEALTTTDVVDAVADGDTAGGSAADSGAEDDLSDDLDAVEVVVDVATEADVAADLATDTVADLDVAESATAEEGSADPSDLDEPAGDAQASDEDASQDAAEASEAKEGVESVELEAAKKTGWVIEGGKTYYYDAKGNKVTGLQKIGNASFYFDASGVMKTGVQKVGTDTYYFDAKSGQRIDAKFVRVAKGSTMYFNNAGKAQFGEKQIGGFKYYFDPASGASAESKFVYQTAEKKTTYHDDLGHMVTGQRNVNGGWYYLKPGSGARAESEFINHTSQSKIVYYGSDGKMCYGETKVGSNWYFFEQGSGKMLYNQFYYVPPASGQKSGKILFLRADGTEARGAYTIGGTKCNFNKNTGALESSTYIKYFTNAGMLNMAQGYSSATGNLILVNLSSHVVSVYSGRQGNWTEVKSFLCGDGAYSTPSPTGVYSLGSKGYFFDSGNSRCFYYSQITGAYLFHSVLYAQTSSPQRVNDGSLGVPVSHGCVRLALENAYYIYSQIPSGTRVVMYRS